MVVWIFILKDFKNKLNGYKSFFDMDVESDYLGLKNCLLNEH